MIILSARFFGTPLFTWRVKTSVDLPPADFKKSIGPLEVELTLGPRTAAVPAHVTDMDQVQPHEVKHEAPPAAVDQWS